MKIVVGLGNPGSEYAKTRHNVGFDVVDALAERLGWVGPGDFDRMARTKFEGLSFDGVVQCLSGEPEKVMLLKPLTFMNVSGRSVAQAVGFYRLLPSDVMVIVDELALPCGTIRLRATGSDNGHNGLKDVQRALGTPDYPRLRIGIDAPPPRVPGKDYVLQRFTPEQREKIDGSIGRAAGAVLTWIDLGLNAAMNQFNAAEKMT